MPYRPWSNSNFLTRQLMKSTKIILYCRLTRYTIYGVDAASCSKFFGKVSHH